MVHYVDQTVYCCSLPNQFVSPPVPYSVEGSQGTLFYVYGFNCKCGVARIWWGLHLMQVAVIQPWQ